MDRIRFTLTASTVLFAFFLTFTSMAQGQVPRAFVSVQGKDTNSCDSPDKPCRNISAAISKVQASGEVVIIDSGSYQPFSVNKSVTVVGAPGAHVAISTPSGDGVKINAPPTAVIALRGLTLHGAGASFSEGIEFAHNNGRTLHVENCVITGFENGIFYNADGNLYVKDTTIRNSSTAAIIIGTNPGKPTGVIERSRLENNNTGIHAIDDVRLIVRDSLIGGHGTGISTGVGPTTGTAEINIENCTITGNGHSGIAALNGGGVGIISVSNSTIAHNNIGILSNASSAVIRVSNTTITRNGEGLSITAGSVLSRANNTLEGNNLDGSFTGTFAAK